ncbi:MAG: hypothetical protein AAFW66_10770, partial [Pseudomonadota bacterium]
TVDKSTPPATDMANGGQKPPPPRINGRKPPKVVIVVEKICRRGAFIYCGIILLYPSYVCIGVPEKSND